MDNETAKLLMEVSGAYCELSDAIYNMEQKFRVSHENVIRTKAHLSKKLHELNCKIREEQP